MANNQCPICGTELDNDLFSAVTGDKVCSLCKIDFIGRLPTSDALIAQARQRLGLKDGEFLRRDRGKRAAEILGHKS